MFIQNGKEYGSEDFDQVTFAPGQDLVLKVNIFDAENRLYSDENDAIANIEFTNV